MAAKMEVNDIYLFNTDAHWGYSILEPGASTFKKFKYEENSNCDFSMKTSSGDGNCTFKECVFNFSTGN